MGLTLDAIAVRAGVHEGTVSKIETGSLRQPSMALLAKLAVAYDMKPGEMVRLWMAGQLVEATEQAS
jgi:transcriptional regulator with XRE-family HTH domain